MAGLLHLGLEALDALAALVGMLGVVLGHLSLVDLHVVLLHMGLEQTGGEEPLVDPVLLTGDAAVLLLLRANPLLVPVDGDNVVAEVGLVREGGSALATVEPNLVVDSGHVVGELTLLLEAESAVSTFEGLLALVHGGHVPGQVDLPVEGETTPGMGADEGDVAVDGVHVREGGVRSECLSLQSCLRIGSTTAGRVLTSRDSGLGIFRCYSRQVRFPGKSPPYLQQNLNFFSQFLNTTRITRGGLGEGIHQKSTSSSNIDISKVIS